MKIHCILHESFEGLANIEEWIDKNNYECKFTRTYLNESFPDPDSLDLLIIMGGTSSVYEINKLNWLQLEFEFVKRVVENNCKILGICFGAQLLASILGAEVYKGTYKEIGWFPITFNKEELSHIPFLPEEQIVFHWHGDTFDIPKDAIRIASSEGVPNQGFIFGNKIIALQFHLEMTPTQISNMLENGKSELAEKGKYIQTPDVISWQDQYFWGNNKLMFSILDFLAN